MVNFDPVIIWSIVAGYIFFSMLVIAVYPVIAAPMKPGLSHPEEIEALDLRNKIRQTTLQICGGAGFLFSVFMALNAQFISIKAQESSNKDLQAKYDRETADLFVKAVESKSPEALYVLGYVAQRDAKSYHETIYRMLASLIRSDSSTACNEMADSKTKTATRIRIALQLLHERQVERDSESTRYNIEHSCLDDIDIKVDQWGKYKGMAAVRASGSNMHRVDFTKTELQKADFSGIATGDWQVPGWENEDRRFELQDLDENGEVKWRAERRKYIAHFIDANLEGANFEGAGLEGADFSGAKLAGASFRRANISRTNFRGADLKWEQLRYSCVGRSDDSKSHQRDQPKFNGSLEAEAKSGGGIPICP
jgi:uncharacterized protein YjbI with pentapeptide repeats